MKDWKAIAKARALEIPDGEMDRVAGALTAMEEAFRPLAMELRPEDEPATAFSAGETA